MAELLGPEPVISDSDLDSEQGPAVVVVAAMNQDITVEAAPVMTAPVEAAPVEATPIEAAPNPNVDDPIAENEGGNPAPDDNGINTGASADENSNDTG